MKSNFKTSTIVILTAVITCILTNTVRDIMFVRDNGKVNNKVSDVVNIIKNYSLYDIDEEKMADYAAAGAVLSLEDHYSNYFTKEEFKSFQTNLSNSFFGIGIVVTVDAEVNKMIVVSPIDGGPAAAAGILTGDYIVAVDGVEYNGEQMSEAVAVMRGDNIEDKEGTNVTVTIERDGERHDYTVVRAVVENDSVNEKMLENNIGYIRITSFNADDAETEDAYDTYSEFRESLDKLKADGMEKLIIDLRGNPGGSLTVVNKIADELLPTGIITYTETKDGKRSDYTSKEGALDIPMVVLVNGGSASASEVLTGALKDYDKAEIIGTKTFGKGIVQTLIPLSDGSGVSVTTSKYYSPNGVCIHGVGIEPDIVVEMDETKQISLLTPEEDIQLQKAVEVLNNK